MKQKNYPPTVFLALVFTATGSCFAPQAIAQTHIAPAATVMASFPCTSSQVCLSRYRCTCDESSRLLTVAEDVDGDGTTDRRDAYRFDNVGNRIWWEVDRDADGIVDVLNKYRFDIEGNLVQHEQTLYVDNSPPVRNSYAYNDLGVIVSRTTDRDLDGSVDDRAAYSYDRMGNRRTLQWDRDGDGLIELYCSYDAPCSWPYSSCERRCVDLLAPQYADGP